MSRLREDLSNPQGRKINYCFRPETTRPGTTRHHSRLGSKGHLLWQLLTWLRGLVGPSTTLLAMDDRDARLGMIKLLTSEEGMGWPPNRVAIFSHIQ